MLTWEVSQQIIRIVMYFVGGLLSAYGIIIPPAGAAGLTVFLTAVGWWAYWQFVRKEPAPPMPEAGGDQVGSDQV